MTVVSLPTGWRVPRWTPAQAVEYARRQVTTPYENYNHLCDHFAGARVWGYDGSGHVSAREHFASIPAAHRHRLGPNDAPPLGAMVFQPQLGQWGHIMLAVGGVSVASNDILRSGRIDIVHWRTVQSRWNAGPTYWTPPAVHSASGINPDHWVPPKPGPAPTPPGPTPRPIVWPIKPGMTLRRVVVLKQAFKWRDSSEHYDPAFVAHVKVWQRRHPQFGAADGIIGPKTYHAITGR